MKPITTSLLVKLVATVVFATIILLALFRFRLQDQLEPFLRWTDKHKILGGIFFSCIYAVCTVLFLPGIVLSLGGGAIFGLAKGVLVVWVGQPLARLWLLYLAGVLCGRFLFREWVTTLTKRYSTWQAVDEAVQDEGWKFVLLLRLAPVIPFSALNYALAVTAIPLWPYTWASAVGIFPGVMLFVYIGSAARDLHEITADGLSLNPAWRLGTLVLSGIAIVLAVGMTTYYARLKMNQRLASEHNSDEDIQSETSGQNVRIPIEASERQPLRGSHVQS